MLAKTLSLALILSGSLLYSTSYAAPLLSHDDVNSTPRTSNMNSWIEVDESAFLRNINKIKSLTKGNTKICAIIKADAYGNGVDLLMPALIKADIPCLGFASNEEARIARKHNYKGTLVRVRTSPINEIKEGLQYNIEELVGGLNHAQKISALSEQAKRPIKIHLSINSEGLSRNGIELATEQGKKDALTLTKLKSIEVTGIMTHFPVEEAEDVKRNLAIFKQQSAWLIKEAKLDRKKITLHSANSFTILNVPEAYLDAIRPGYIIYNNMDSDLKLDLEDIVSFKTVVATVNSYPKGNTVGYDRTAKLSRDSRLANLPLGYSDGLARAPEGKTIYVLINGHRVPLIGKVSMNTSMADVTDFPDIKEGDEVVIYGKQKAAQITTADVEDTYDIGLSQLYVLWGNSNPKILVNKSK